MESMTTLSRAAPFTRADLDAMPDDGRRHELIDGVLVVTPAPGYAHQVVAGRLHLVLAASCPPDLRVLFAPFDVVLAEDTVMEPDLLVARRTSFTRKDLPAAPLLAIEILSPSTRRVDLTLKWARFEAAGCLSYWVVDPLEPSLTAWELRDGAYVEVARVSGDQPFEAVLPYPLRIVPSELLD